MPLFARPLPSVVALGLVLSGWAVEPSKAQGVEAPAGMIEGIVYDSLLARGPLRDATVYVIGPTLTATTDARGRFTIGGVPDGTHTLTFSHPAFDSAGVARHNGRRPLRVVRPLCCRPGVGKAQPSAAWNAEIRLV